MDHREARKFGALVRLTCVPGLSTGRPPLDLLPFAPSASSVDPRVTPWPPSVPPIPIQAQEWWDPRGPFAPLHAMNPPRCGFLRDALARLFAGRPPTGLPLSGLRILDVGCGGGLLCEPLVRLGADVTGIDAAPEGVGAARAHARGDPGLASCGRLAYRTASAEQLLAGGEAGAFDAVVALEVVEHVVDPEKARGEGRGPAARGSKRGRERAGLLSVVCLFSVSVCVCVVCVRRLCRRTWLFDPCRAGRNETLATFRRIDL